MKHFRENWKDSMLLICSIILFLLALILPAACALGCTNEEAQLKAAYEKNEIIRLHVIAHNDSAKDQEIKYAVRDALIEEFGSILTDTASDCETAYQALLENKEAMRMNAQKTAISMGFYGDVQAETGLLELPEKRYGNVVLPAGRYRALRIVIGNGDGQNWWCVLYPQLCLALSEEDGRKPITWDSLRILSNWLAFVN